MGGTLLAGGAAVAVATLVLASCNGGTPASQPPGGSATDDRAEAAARRFLDRYMDADGRVVRRDEGGDTVSEGAAYAMLLAVAVGERGRFDRAWAWARANLQRPDGLLSWRWRDGRVADVQPAADADLDAARALVLAADRFGSKAYVAEGKRLAAAILGAETLRTPAGPLLLAGPWATAAPHYLNPSYFSPRAYALLAETTGEEAWEEAAEASYRALGTLVEGDARLPPDWAVAEAGGAVRAAAAPGAGGPGPQYGFDAVRAPVRMAEDCDRRGRDLAAQAWVFLGERHNEGRLVAAYGLDGRPAAEYEHAAAMVGAAGAATAADDEEAAAELLDRAEALDAEHPTYYGAAWVALGRVMLTTDLLGGC